MEDENRVEETVSQEEVPSTDDTSEGFTSGEETAKTAVTDHHSEDTELPAESDTREELPVAEEPPLCEHKEELPAAEKAPYCEHKDDYTPEDDERLKLIEGNLGNLVEAGQRLFSEVREMHKLYHSEFAGRLKTMQEELEQYRKIDKGRAYDDILASIARIYGNNETLADEVADPKAQKNIRYMLMDMEDLLNVYGMIKLRSATGDKRNPRHCQIHDRIPTEDPEKHDTVVRSYNSGFHIGNRTVIKEVVDIYIYDGQVPVQETEEEENIEAGEVPATE